jgi:hypothetical protein
MSKVYLTQEIPVDRETGQPKYNVLGASKYGDIVSLLPMYSQIILSPGPLILKLRTLLIKLRIIYYSQAIPQLLE